MTDSESELPSTWLSLKLGDVLAYGKTEKAEPEEIAPETWVLELLIRPCEVLSRVANVTILEVANNALRVLLQHRHVIIGSLA